MKVYESGKMTSKGQLTFPAPLREEFNMSEGDRLEFILTDDGEAVVKVRKKKTLMDFVGILKTEGEFDFERDRQNAKDYVSQKYKEEVKDETLS